jgi:hypothetical protein
VKEQEHHRLLQLPKTKAAIGKAMPMLTGEFTAKNSPSSVASDSDRIERRLDRLTHDDR